MATKAEKKKEPVKKATKVEAPAKPISGPKPTVRLTPEPSAPVRIHPAEKLTKKDIEMFSALLEEEKKKLLRHLENLSDSSETELTPSASGDAADLAALEISQANLQKIGKREQYLLKKIELAIEKIKDGTFGDCENCGEPIGVARLRARPVAQLCIDCKTEQENVERKFTSRDIESGGDDDVGEGDEEAD